MIGLGGTLHDGFRGFRERLPEGRERVELGAFRRHRLFLEVRNHVLAARDSMPPSMGWNSSVEGLDTADLVEFR